MFVSSSTHGHTTNFHFHYEWAIGNWIKGNCLGFCFFVSRMILLYVRILNILIACPCPCPFRGILHTEFVEFHEVKTKFCLPRNSGNQLLWTPYCKRKKELTENGILRFVCGKRKQKTEVSFPWLANDKW